MGIAITQVDAFASAPFTGNPAAVCWLPETRAAAWMQSVAREMNLSETAFLEKRSDGFGLRWFTPAIEVDLCGHATLASAHVLWETGQCAAGEQIRFHTRSGVLTVISNDGWIELDFPAKLEQPSAAPPGLANALGAEPVHVGKKQFDYLVELDSELLVRNLDPDHGSLKKLPVRGVIVTARGGEYDFVSRFFAPGSGVDEDPVTGSAHCALAPYWGAKLNKNEMVAYQASRRGGLLKVRVDGDRVHLGGCAVTVLRGELLA